MTVLSFQPRPSWFCDFTKRLKHRWKLLRLNEVRDALKVTEPRIGNVPRIVIDQCDHAINIGFCRDRASTESGIKTITHYQGFLRIHGVYAGDKPLPPGLFHGEAVIAGAISIRVQHGRAIIRVKRDGLVLFPQQGALALALTAIHITDAHGHTPLACLWVDRRTQRRITRLADL